MKKIKLKKNILVKEKSKSEAFVLDIDTDGIFKFSDDMARLMMLISKQTKSKPLSFEELQLKLGAKSARFKKNNKQKELLTHALNHLKKSGFIEINA